MSDFELKAAFAARYGRPDPENLAPLAGNERHVQILSRRSCRRFQNLEVPDALLATLAACAQSAPSKSDLQQFSIVLIDSAETRQDFLALPTIPDWAATAPCILVFCADTHRTREIGKHHGHAYDCNTVDSLVNATGDAAIALSAFILAAEANGLGTCPLSVVRNHIQEVTDLLGLPEGVFPFCGLCLGWPAESRPVSVRWPLKSILHRDRYKAGLEPGAIQDYDARRPRIREANQLHKERFGSSDTIPWSEQVARREAVRERPGFRAYLDRQGFDLD
ncbi:MAG: nitroreductase family protein [Geminicoccaceae bacterium]